MAAEITHVAVVIGPGGETRVRLAVDDIRAGSVWIGSGEDCAIRIPDVAAHAAIVFEWSTRIFARRDASEVPRTPRESDDELANPARFGASVVAIQRYSGAQVVLCVDDEEIELGDFHDVWKQPVTIGSAADNRVVLAGLGAHAATLTARSNHRYLEVDGEARRVDHRDFQLGPYTVRIEED